MKLRQEVYENTTLIKATDYIGSLILENDTLQFIQTAEGRVVPKNVDGVDKNEYQYHLKDHLGNVRSTFAVRDDEFAANFEKVLVGDVLSHYNPYFNNYDSIMILSNPLKRSGNYAHRLAGGGSDVVGLMKTLYVSKGDRVSAEVYGKYLDAQFTDDGINGNALINALVTMLGGSVLNGEGTTVQNNLNSNYISAAMADGSDEESPKAYLNYIMLDKNFNYVNSGFERLSESAADPGDGSGTHQKLSFEEIQIEEDGYLMVFLSNESQESIDVFWDDFKVDHHYNAVLQADDYYPFGLTFNGYTRNNSKANNYKYNGKEEQEETGWIDYGARMYQPDLGRWKTIDPKADKYHPTSPFAFVANDPISLIDPDGKEIINPYEKGTDKYKTAQRIIAVLEKSNPALYSTLDKTEIKINIYLRNPDIYGRKHYGNTEVIRNVQLRRGMRLNRILRDSQGEPFGYFSSNYWSKDMYGRTSGETIYNTNKAKDAFNSKKLADISEINISIDPNLSDDKKLETLAHEGGHTAHALDNSFEAWIWGIIGDENHTNGAGHDRYNPSGKKAEQEQSKAGNFINNLSLEEWEKIANEFNKDKEDE